MITEFKVKNFRCFRELHLPRLARINLFAGDNGVGKTSLLEALFLHLGPTNPELALRVNSFRGIKAFDNRPETLWGWLFHDRNLDAVIQTESKTEHGAARALAIRLGQMREGDILLKKPEGGAEDVASGSTDFRAGSPDLVFEFSDSLGVKFVTRGLLIPDGAGRYLRVTGAEPGKAMPVMPLAAFFNTYSANVEEDAERFDAIVREGLEDKLASELKAIEPRLRDVRSGRQGGKPIVYTNVGLHERMPLSYAGDGVCRLMRYLLGAHLCKGGALLIDEVENGFHHSKLTALWQALFRAACGYELQMFLSTHSWECIGAAADVFARTEPDEFLYHRLERKDGEAKVVSIEPRHLKTAVTSEMEVR